ncbi:MAG: T9SS type A sorting domain-containing protein [Bacteroidota bacterium]
MRLKNFTLTILLIFSFGFANAQCEIENGSFEDWIETEFILPDGMGGEASGDVILPEGCTPLLRLLFLGFSAAFDPAIGQLLENQAQELSGIIQSTDASDGEFAVRLEGGFGLDVADIYRFQACSEIPGFLNLDVKHVGETNDTLRIFGVFDEGLGAIPQDEEDILTYPAVAAFEAVINTNTEYSTISIPVVQNFDVPVDTFYYVIFTESFDDSYFLVDNVRFSEDDTICDIPTPVVSLLDEEAPTCVCHGLEVSFLIEYMEDPAFQYNELIINEDGIIESIDVFDKGNHGEFCSFSENLRLVVIAYEGDVDGLLEGSNVSDLMGCFELSNEISIETTTFPEFSFNVFIDDEMQGENISICLLDEVIEVLSFSAIPTVDNVSIFLIDVSTEIVVLRIDDINETTTLPDINPGEYFLGVVGYDEAFNLEVGQTTEDISFEGCFSIPEDEYIITVLGEGNDCTTDVEEIYSGNLSIRPNYSSGLFEVYNPNSETYRFVVRDITGKVVTMPNNTSNQIDLREFTDGVYIVTFDIEGYVHQEKIVKL